MNKTLLNLFSLLMLASLALLPTQAQAQFGGFGDHPVTLELQASKTQARPGDQVILVLKVDISTELDQNQKTWHIYPPQGVHDGVEVASSLTPNPGAAFVAGQVQWPEPTFIKNLQDKQQPVYEEQALIYVPLIVKDDAAIGEQTITVDFTYQPCNSQCIAPTDKTLEMTIEVVARDAEVAGTDQSGDELFAGFDPTIWVGLQSGEGVLGEDEIANGDEPKEQPARSSTITLAGVEFDPSSFAGLAILLGFAVLGGALLNFTPCVLPVIPIKIMGLSQSAGTRQKTILLGFIMFAGVMTFWLVIAAALVFFKGFSAPSQLFATWWFSIAIGLLIVVMAVGMLGVWNTKLPQWVYRINPKHDSVHGSFGFGVMTAVLALPCTGPFLGTAIGWATTTSSFMVMLVFAALGAGMGLPYLVLLMFPKLVDKMPRAGEGSELLKQVLGLFMLAAAFYFLAVGTSALLRGIVSETVPPNTSPELAAAMIEGGQRLVDSFSAVMWWPIFLTAAAAGLWLVFKLWQIKVSAVSRTIFSGLGLMLAFAAFALALALGQPVKKGDYIQWAFYTPATYEQAISSGDVVVLDFTADWCPNCKWLEANKLETDMVRGLLNGEGVVPIKVDLTSRENNPGWDLLKKVGRSSIPQLVVYKPGGEIDWISEWYDSDDVVQAIEAAMSTGVAQK
ncbi:MAG: cytochrome c biogenesis protein CcdA [Planctomycetota bacterium]